MNKFIRDLIERGEAARRNADGSLPAGATHEIVGEDENGEPIVVRRRVTGRKISKKAES